jgi:PAS domain S-box-containing protein
MLVDEDGSIRVLVVEDNPTQANLLRISLTRRGFDVICAPNLAEALEYLGKGGIGVILLDLSLPDSDGIQTFYDMYANAGQVPIVVLTAINDQKVAYQALKGGAQDFLVKGLPSDESVVRCLRYAIQRQQFETELWQSERRTRLILENAQDAFFAINEHGVVEAWNTQAENMFGWMRQDAQGTPLVGLIIPHSKRKDFNQEIKLFRNGLRGTLVNNRVEMSLLHKDGHELPAEVTFFAISEDSNHTFCAFVRDISHRKEFDDRIRLQLEQRLVDRMADMERANNELQRYNRAITDEIRKPLELIGQYSDSLREKLLQGGDKESIESIKVIAQQCDRVLRLVRPTNGDAETTHRHSAITLKATDTWTSYNPPQEIINEAAQLHKREG